MDVVVGTYRLVLEFGKRLSELTRDWTVWATDQIAQDKNRAH
jgi:hypothetical protein